MRGVVKVPAFSGLFAVTLLIACQFAQGAAQLASTSIGTPLPPFPTPPASPAPPAPPAPQLDFVGQWPEETRGFNEDAVMADGFLTVAAGSGGVQTFDLRTPPAPARAGELYGLPDLPWSIGRDGMRGMVAGFNGWLAALDFSNSAAPAVTWQTNGSLRYPVLAVSGHLAVVAGVLNLTGTMGIEVWDLSNPAQPVLRGSLTREQTWTDGNLIFDGTHAYLRVSSSASGLLHVNVSQPDAPTASLVPNSATIGVRLSRSGDRLLGTGNYRAALWDVRNPAAPTLLSTNLTTASGIQAGLLDGNLAYLAEVNTFPSNTANLHIVDVSDPAQPVTLGTAPLNATGAVAVRRVGLFAVAVVTRREGVQIIGAANPAQPRLISVAGAGGHALRVEPNGIAAYVADGHRLRVLDIAAPQAPALLPPVAGVSTMSVRDIARQVTNLVVVGEQRRHDVVSTADPLAPAFVRSFLPPGNDRGASVGVLDNGYFLVGQDGPQGWIDAFRAPGGTPQSIRPQPIHASPALIGRGFPDTNPVIARGANLTVLGLVFLGQYSRVGNLELSFTPSALAGDQRGLAYIAGGTNGLLVADVSVPAQPRLIATNVTRGPARGVTVRWPYVFVAEGFAGVEVFDATNPTNLVAVAHFDTRGEAESISLEGDRVYVADGARGVTILRWGYGPLPAPELVDDANGRWLRLEFAVAPEHAAGTRPQGAPAADGPWTDLPAEAVTQADGRFVVRLGVDAGPRFLRVRYPAL